MKGFSLNLDQIRQYLKIEPPFLMIDYVNEIVPGKRALGVKKIKKDDWFIKCHFGFWKNSMCMPAALQVEAMAQTLALTIYTMEEHKESPCFEVSMNIKMFSKALPDNQLIIHANLLSFKRGIGKGFAETTVNDIAVSKGEFTFVSPHILPTPKV